MGNRTVTRDSLIFVSDAARAGVDPRAFRKAAARGELIRVRRGVYCDRNRWDDASERERHVLRIHAVLADARNPVTFAGASAAAVWGIPTASPPPHEVIVLDRYRGGGRSEPGVIRQTSGASTAEAVIIDGIPVTTLARTALDMASGAPFPEAVAYVDWARWRRNPHAVDRDALTSALAGMGPRTGRATLFQVIGFSTDLSESFAESFTRAVIHELGFVAPVLQLPVRDQQGEMRPDFAWPDVMVAAEYDGRSKYSDPALNGGDPVEALWRERRREARLRRRGWTVVRMEWPDVMQRERLAGLLAGAGVPRR